MAAWLKKIRNLQEKTRGCKIHEQLNETFLRIKLNETYLILNIREIIVKSTKLKPIWLGAAV
jgi:hypothetical protein